MKQSVNYIKHLEGWSDRICHDDRLTPHHVSLYYALFHQWNLAKFQNPISICRSELMLGSKIGSANTYTKCLKQLDEWGYIHYLPSFNPTRGSLVNLYSFDKSSSQGIDKGSNKASEIAVRPSLNNTNNLNLQTTKTNKTKTSFSPPSLEMVKAFFIEVESTQAEGENFYNYFESNGWLVGGKAKMKNWQAAAKNWIKRSAKFNPSSTTRKNASVNEDKDYSTPL